MGDYYLDPLLIVGTEGMWGLLYYLLALIPLQLIHPCGPGYVANPGVLGAMCNFGYLENSAYAFYQMKNNGWLVFETVCSTFSIAFFNTFGIATTKYASAAQRSTIDTSRTILIWLLSWALGLQPLEPWSIIGFVMLAGGTLVFNEILVVPFLGFDKNTADAIAKRKKKAGGADDQVDQNYVSLSPHAAYDTQRNRRALQAD